MRKKTPVYGYGLPVGALVAWLFHFDSAVLIVVIWMASNILGLCASDALRRQAAQCLSVEKIGKMLSTSLLLSLLPLIFIPFFQRWELFVIGAMMNQLRCLCEMMCIRREYKKLLLMDLLTATGTIVVGVCFQEQWKIAFCILFAFLLLLGGLMIRRNFKIGFHFQLLQEIPSALCRQLPWVFLSCILFFTDVPEILCLTGVLGASIVQVFTRSVFRRSPEESACLNAFSVFFMFLASVTALLMEIGFQNSEAAKCFLILLPSFECALMVYGSARPKVLFAGAGSLLIGLFACLLDRFVFTLNFMLLIAWTAIYCAFLCLLMKDDWIRLFQIRRARRIQRNAQRKGDRV